MALPTTGISTSLVAQTIGSGSGDVGTLCSHSNINKWSKFKPVSHPEKGSLYGATGTDVTKIASVNYGLSAATSTDFYTASATGWTYIKPTGGENSPYRLGDFRGYNHSAKAPIRLENPDTTINSMYQSTYNIMYIVAPNDSPDNISIGNLPTISSYYLGVVFSGVSGDYPVTSSTTIGAGATSLTLNLNAAPFNTFTNETLNCRTLCFQNAREQGTVLGSNTYYPAPTDEPGIYRTVRFIRTIGLSAQNTNISSNSSPVFNMLPIEQFQNAQQGMEVYFRSNGAMFFDLRLTNITGQDIVIPVNLLTLQFGRTLARTTEITLPAVVYKNNVLVTDNIVIPVGQYVDLVVGHATALGINSAGSVIAVNSTYIASVPVVLFYNGVNPVTTFSVTNVQGI